MINDVEVSSSNEIKMKILNKSLINVNYQMVTRKMSILCSSIICSCAKETYGETWTKINMFSCPPWSFLECLKRFKRYWTTVFRDKMLKQFPKALDETLKWLQNHECKYKITQEKLLLVIHIKQKNLDKDTDLTLADQ